MKQPQNRKMPDALNALIADFEANRADVEALVERLNAASGEGANLAGEMRERVENLAQRVEMMHFSLCQAERRGAILELLADFRAGFGEALPEITAR